MYRQTDKSTSVSLCKCNIFSRHNNLQCLCIVLVLALLEIEIHQPLCSWWSPVRHPEYNSFMWVVYKWASLMFWKGLPWTVMTPTTVVGSASKLSSKIFSLYISSLLFNSIDLLLFFTSTGNYIVPRLNIRVSGWRQWWCVPLVAHTEFTRQSNSKKSECSRYVIINRPALKSGECFKQGIKLIQTNKLGFFLFESTTKAIVLWVANWTPFFQGSLQ